MDDPLAKLYAEVATPAAGATSSTARGEAMHPQPRTGVVAAVRGLSYPVPNLATPRTCNMPAPLSAAICLGVLVRGGGARPTTWKTAREATVAAGAVRTPTHAAALSPPT